MADVGDHMTNYLILILIVVGAVFFIGASGVFGVDGGGELNDPSYYCKILVKGNLIGNNIALEDLECGINPYPSGLLAGRLIGGDEKIYCSAKVNSWSFGDQQYIGDLGFTESELYTFKISNLAEGSHKITVRCQGKSASAEKTFDRVVA